MLNDANETWSLRWQTLHRALAPVPEPVTFRSALPTLKAVYLRRVTLSSGSWLSRVQNRAPL
jgi:hypothetical protein